MIAWVMMQGEASEGGSVIGVFTEPASAVDYAESNEEAGSDWGIWRVRGTMHTRTDDSGRWQRITRHEVHK